MISVAEALERIRREVTPLEPESVALSSAGGRVLARDVLADADFPPFDTTAMDGYAVSETADGPRRYRERAGVVAAGDGIPEPAGPGEAVRVMTGAPVPPGSVAVVPVEESAAEPGAVRLSGSKAGAHIRRRGEIFRRGDVLLPAEARLWPEAVLLCATAGADPVAVRRRPRCAVAPTGGEIVPVAARPEAGQIRNGNGPALAAALALRGIRADELPAVADRRADLEELFSRAAGVYDLLLTTGGVSAGDFDETANAASAAGFRIVFHGVAIKPGKPVAFGRRGRALWFGLPGNPVSATTTFEVFAAAALDFMEGRPARVPLEAELAAPVRHRPGREGYLDARLYSESGRLIAEPLPTRGSHDIAGQSRRNALLIAPAEGGSFPAGARLPCLPLREPGA